MRALTATLALFGSVWATLGLYGAMMMLAYPPEAKPDVIHFSVTVGLFSTGYLVWWGWVFYSFKERFPFATQRTFWIVALAHHVLCFLYLIVMDGLGRGDDPLSSMWVIGNVVIAAIVLARRPWNRTQAEPGVDPSA